MGGLESGDATSIWAGEYMMIAMAAFWSYWDIIALSGDEVVTKDLLSLLGMKIDMVTETLIGTTVMTTTGAGIEDIGTEVTGPDMAGEDLQGIGFVPTED